MPPKTRKSVLGKVKKAATPKKRKNANSILDKATPKRRKNTLNATVNSYYTREPGKSRHNCFSYSFQLRGGGEKGTKPQPGDLSKAPPLKKVGCTDIAKRVLKDLGGRVRKKPQRGTCSAIEDEIAMYTTRGGDDADYHFYMRKAGEQFFTHKRGLGSVYKTDACRKKIQNPEKACRNYSNSGGHDYAIPCTRFCHRRLTSPPIVLQNRSKNTARRRL